MVYKYLNIEASIGIIYIIIIIVIIIIMLSILVIGLGLSPYINYYHQYIIIFYYLSSILLFLLQYGKCNWKHMTISISDETLLSEDWCDRHRPGWIQWRENQTPSQSESCKFAGNNLSVCLSTTSYNTHRLTLFPVVLFGTVLFIWPSKTTKTFVKEKKNTKNLDPYLPTHKYHSALKQVFGSFEDITVPPNGGYL